MDFDMEPFPAFIDYSNVQSRTSYDLQKEEDLGHLNSEVDSELYFQDEDEELDGFYDEEDEEDEEQELPCLLGGPPLLSPPVSSVIPARKNHEALLLSKSSSTLRRRASGDKFNMVSTARRAKKTTGTGGGGAGGSGTSTLVGRAGIAKKSKSTSNLRSTLSPEKKSKVKRLHRNLDPITDTDHQSPTDNPSPQVGTEDNDDLTPDGETQGVKLVRDIHPQNYITFKQVCLFISLYIVACNAWPDKLTVERVIEQLWNSRRQWCLKRPELPAPDIDPDSASLHLLKCQVGGTRSKLIQIAEKHIKTVYKLEGTKEEVKKRLEELIQDDNFMHTDPDSTDTERQQHFQNPSLYEIIEIIFFLPTGSHRQDRQCSQFFYGNRMWNARNLVPIPLQLVYLTGCVIHCQLLKMANGSANPKKFTEATYSNIYKDFAERMHNLSDADRMAVKEKLSAIEEREEQRERKPLSDSEC